MLGIVLGEVPERNGVLGEVLGKVLVLLVPRRDTRGEHFSEHFPEHPVSGRHLSEHSPEHFWAGGWGFYTSVGGRPFAMQEPLRASHKFYPLKTRALLLRPPKTTKKR